ncbi:MAG TPA: hypothetical protein VLA19_25615, partial [Herpetosiphonaceae bacterium]|nr:hypothetical protein [Herpetosiphonaceae bacterium]
HRRLIDARGQHDQQTLTDLLIVFDFVQESAWSCGDETVGSLVMDMIGATQDSLMGVEWKSTIPSAEALASVT